MTSQRDMANLRDHSSQKQPKIEREWVSTPKPEKGMMTVECPSETEPKTAYEFFRKHYSPPKKVVEIEESE